MGLQPFEEKLGPVFPGFLKMDSGDEKGGGEVEQQNPTDEAPCPGKGDGGHEPETRHDGQRDESDRHEIEKDERGEDEKAFTFLTFLDFVKIPTSVPFRHNQ